MPHRRAGATLFVFQYIAAKASNHSCGSRQKRQYPECATFQSYQADMDRDLQSNAVSRAKSKAQRDHGDADGKILVNTTREAFLGHRITR